MKSDKKIILSHYSILQRVILWLACGFGTGLIRPAPGTWGTLPGVLIAYFVMPYPQLHLFLIVILTIAGIWLCQKASNILGAHDHGSIVIDEIVGVLITLWLFSPTWGILLLGFIWFRLFDIAKPFPIKWIDKKVHGGLGIMLDDIVAGIFAFVGLKVTLYLSINLF